MKPRQLGASGYVLEHAMKEVFTLTHNGMKQIPTAREFYDAHESDDAVVMMRDFAKMHVEAALKAASATDIFWEKFSYTHRAEHDKESILNSYPPTNIK